MDVILFGIIGIMHVSDGDMQFQSVLTLQIKLIVAKMDSRIYFHQYRRPRVSNPTYLSSNVQNSMSFFGGSNFSQPYTKREYLNRYNDEPQIRNNTKAPPTPIDNYRPQQEAPQRRTQNEISAYRPQLPHLHPKQSPQSHEMQPEQRVAAGSKLSNYGQRSLTLDQRGVHDRQTSKFDIINLKPREHSQDIRQYPWLTVQNRDDVYYRRMNQLYNHSKPQSRAKTMEKQTAGGVVAGRHTYDLQPKATIDPQKAGGRYFSPKMLNHMDELQHNLA